MPEATKLVDLPRVRALARLFRHGDVKPESPQEVGEPHLAVEPTTDDLRWFGVGLRCTRYCPTCACGSASTHAGEKEELPPSHSVVAVFQTDGRGGAGRRGTSLWGPRIPACRAACSGDLRRL